MLRRGRDVMRFARGPVRLNHDAGRALCHPAIARQAASVFRDAHLQIHLIVPRIAGSTS